MKTINLFGIQISIIITFLFPGRILAQSCPDGLISYWKLNETGGVTLIDNAGGHNATCNTAPSVDPAGIIGSSRYFLSDSASGITAVISNSAAYDFAAGTSFTIICWVKYTDADLEGREHIIISRGNYHQGNPQGTFWAEGIDPTGNLYFILQDSESHRTDVSSPVKYSDGNWHQVAFVRNNADKSNTLYVDGLKSSSKSSDYAGNFSSAEPVQFGSLKNSLNNGASNSFYFQGSLDEVAVLDTVLTADNLSNQILLANSDIGICDGLNANIISTPMTTAIVGSPYLYTVHAGGLQNGMSYELLSGPDGMVIDSLSGIVSWTPDDISTVAMVEIRAKNYIPPADTQAFRIYLAEGTPCPEGLIVLLKLDETNGPVYADFYGDHNSTATIPPTATKGKLAGAQLFNAETQLDIPDLATEFDWSKDSSFSYEYWLNTTVMAEMICIARFSVNAPAAAFVSSGVDATGKAQFELRDNSGKSVIAKGTSMIADGKWHYIIDVRDGKAKENRIYVDGLEESIQSIIYDSSFRAYEPTPVNIGYLHRKRADEPAYHFQGSIDELAIYNRALTAEEAFSFYNHNNPDSHCGAGNYAPYIVSSPVTEASTNNTYSYFFIANDLDSTDILTLSAVNKPQWLTFSWLPGQENASLAGIPSETGQFPVTLRVSDGSVDIDQEFTIVVTPGVPTAAKDLEKEGIRIYPVPADDQLIISMEEIRSPTRLEIINGDGRILRREIMNPGEVNHVLALDGIANGTYFLHIQNEELNSTGSFIIAR